MTNNAKSKVRRKWFEEVPSTATGWERNFIGGWQPPDEAIDSDDSPSLPANAKPLPMKPRQLKMLAEHQALCATMHVFSASPEELVPEVIEAMESTGQDASKVDRTALAEKIKEAQWALRHVIRVEDGIRIWRPITRSQFDALKPGAQLGCAWSFDLYCTAFPETSAPDALVLTGNVSRDAVDWIATMVVFIAGEGDIRLHTGAAVRLHGIRKVGPEQGSETDEGSHLVGKLFQT